jgi:cyclopropane fatty-acyl-phospholipid synthase-like methyltransferase
MSGKDNADLASMFGVPIEIVPFIPDLLADLWALGVPPEVVVELLRPMNMPPRSTRVLDLGCGKGAVSLTVARELGFTVDGVDFFPPFIEEAGNRAKDMGLSESCRFSEGDIREVVKKGGEYDVAMLIWVGGALGDPGKSVGRLRHMVRPGGYMVYAEGYLKDGIRAKISHGGRLHHKKILRRLAAHGDIVVREAVVPDDQTRSLYTDYLDSLRNGARKITHEHPEHRRSLEDHIISQEQMCRTLESSVVPAVWLLRKN